MSNPAPQKTKNRNALIVLFATTLFMSAALMFVLQPMFGKLLLPLLGGSPAVWNTCMVFYQSILFLGYWYAHALATGQPHVRQVYIHATVILLSVIALPVALPSHITPPTETDPTFWLFWMLLLAIGLPFFVVSSTAPLLQKWFSQVGHHTSDDPYYLYAASNAGSLLALLSYPFLIEPNIGLSWQKTGWSIGYSILCLMLISCAWVLFKSHQIANSPRHTETTSTLNVSTQLHWLVLAFIPSSLLLGLTNFISTDIASVPLLWIIPLTVYLISFIFVFSKWNDKLLPIMVLAQAIFLVPFVTYAFINPADLPYWAYLALHVLAFFFAIMVCHGQLAKMRPPTQHLTRFYLIMSFAGMLGGIFNTFIAPFIFNGIFEYPIMVVLALLLRPALKPTLKRLAIPVALSLVTAFTGFVLYVSVANLTEYFDAIAISLIVLACLSFIFRAQAIGLASLTGTIIFLAINLHGLASHTLYQKRTFFGVLSVRESLLIDEKNQPESYHELFHGTTKHGAQRLAEGLSKIPLTYYSQPGPMGQLFSEYGQKDQDWEIGAVGLGAGALACYAKPGQHWTLYEIDPLVLKIALDSDYFSYLKQCAPNASIAIGDARLSIAKEPEHHFDLLVMDAFSSDSVPTHLLTQEAITLYFEKLKTNGILAFHITNRHLLLKKVLSIHAEQLHLAALIQEFSPQHEMPLVVATDWVVLAKQPETLQPLLSSRLGSWQKMPLYFDMKPWSDDFTNIVSIWK
ncbi:MAG: fused MFS/spermidine synthase [Methylococcaceae bacterium]|jgi:hypothetical protein